MLTNVNYSKEFIQSILAYFSYVNMEGSSDGSITWSDFQGENLSSIQNLDRFIENFNKYLGNKYDIKYGLNEYNNAEYILKFFTDNFIIVDQLVTRGFDGFSATTFELKNDLPLYGYQSGDTFLVYRGTEATQIADWATDFNITFSDKAGDSDLQKKINEFFGHISQETHGIEYLEALINKLNKKPDGTMLAVPRQVYIAGHSLGGFLSVRSLLSLEEKHGIEYALKYVKSVSTFNGAGLAVTDGWLTGKDALANIVKNFYSVRGFNVTSSSFIDMFKGNGTTLSLFEHLGKRYPTITENEGAIDNHNMSLLMHTLGFFSTLDTLVQGYPDKVKDIYDQILTGESAKIYSINQLVMNAAYVESDFGYALSNIAQKIIQGFGLNLDYNSSIATFMGLKEYFTDHPELKLSIHDNFKNISLTDSNSNRSSFYSLMNDLSYVLIVPESYNEGIFKRTAESELYNIENYEQEYLDYRIIYNKAVTELMERKLMQVLPYYIDMEGVGKYVFIVETALYEEDFTASNSSYQKEIFINSNESDIENKTANYIYMKSNKSRLMNVYRDDAIVFDTAMNDTLTIYSNNNIIHSMNGVDYINFRRNFKDGNFLTGNIVLITDKTDIVYIHNISPDINSLIISFKTATDQLKINAVGLTNDLVNNRMVIKNGSQLIEVVGLFKLDLNETIVEYKDIYATISNFPEIFAEVNFDINTEVNQLFIDTYISIIKNRFNDGISIPDNKITERLANYVIEKLKQYTLDSNINTLAIQNTIKEKIYESELKNTFNPEIKNIMDETIVVIKGIPIKDLVYSKLNNYAVSKYDSLNIIDDENNTENGEAFDGMYYQKNTKNYNAIQGELGIHYVWDGKYYYDRVDENGEKIANFYGNISAGAGYKRYLKENLLIKNDGSSSYSEFRDVYGSDGSDIIIGDNVYGQSLYYIENDKVLSGDSKLRQNGDDILIGNNVSAYSGNNLIVSRKDSNNFGVVLKGGRGNDTIISRGDNGTIIADQNSDENESYLNENTLLLLKGGSVFSSNGKNIIYSKNGTIFATGNDTVYMENSSFYGYSLKSFEEKFKDDYDKQENYLKTFENETGFSFYNKYPTNDKINKIYDYGQSVAYLKKYDTIYTMGESGTITGLGFNSFEIYGNRKLIISGGNSLLTINGIENTIYFEADDKYNIIYGEKNNFYARGLNSNTESSIIYDEYVITGIRNNLYLGDNTYNAILKGYNTRVTYTKNTNKNQNITINEIGESYIELDENNIKSINVKASNSFGIGSNSGVSYINMLSVDAADGFIISDKNISINSLHINTLIINSKLVIGLLVDAEIIESNLENIRINGTISKNEIFNFTGHIEELKINNEEEIATKINITGFIKKLEVWNANEFNYIKTFNNDIRSNVLIVSSSLKTIGGMSDYNFINLDVKDSEIEEIKLNNVESSTLIFHETSSIKKINIGDLKQSGIIVLSNTNEINILKYDRNGAGFDIMGRFNNLKLKIANLELNGVNLNNLYITTAPNRYAISVTIDNFDDLNIKTNLDTIVQLSNSTGIVNIHDGLAAGTFSNLNVLNMTNISDIQASIEDINTINLEIDGLSYIPIVNQVNNLNFITNSEKIITRTMIGKFYLDDDYPEYTLKLGSNFFTKNEIKQIRDNLIDEGAYAIIKESGVEYVQPVITDPEFPYIDENNIYQGTSRDDVFNLTDGSKSYTLNGKAGNDTYNFESEHYMMNTINYKAGDGFDTVNVKQYAELTLNLNNISISDLTFTIENNVYGLAEILNIFKNGDQIFKLNNYDKINLHLKTLEGRYQNYDILKLINTIKGTDGNDVINGTDKNNYIYSGKGDDTINLTGSSINEIYYNLDDGHDIVNSPNTSYTVIFDYNINMNNILYQATGSNSFNVLLDNQIIMTINEADKANLQYLSHYETITGIDVLEDLKGIMGTENDDIINVDTATVVKSKGGDDIINVNNNQAKIYAGAGIDTININYEDLSNASTVYYNNGDGITQINLLKDVFNEVKVQINSLSPNQLKYEYDVNNHDTLNIYYSFSYYFPIFYKMIVIENYRRSWSDTHTTGRAFIKVGEEPIDHATIDEQAELNYNLAINSNS